MIWFNTLVSVVGVSVISLLGVLAFKFRESLMRRFILVLVSFSAGALLGDVFVHLIPEIVEEEGTFALSTSLTILGSILMFFVLEKFIHWRHSHALDGHDEHEHHVKALAFVNLTGDALHNFIDGMIIAGGYLLSPSIGFATTVAVILHEIPQEIGDFALLIHSGMKTSKALIFNFVSASFAILGAVLVLLIGANFEDILVYLIRFTVGGFIYIAASDIIPELHRETKPSNSIVQFFSFAAGIGIMVALLFVE